MSSVVINYDALAKPLSRPRKLKPDEALGVFHESFPRDVVPPLTSMVVLDMSPPMYIFGWQYTVEDFCERFGGDDCLNDLAEMFRLRFENPFRQNYHHLVEFLPFIYVYDVYRICNVIIGSNNSEGSMMRTTNEELMEAAKVTLKENREPLWYRHPPQIPKNASANR